MSSFLKRYLQSFLSCTGIPEPTDEQIDIILQCSKKADHEHLSKGDIILPLKARPLQALVYVEGSKTLLGKLIENPSDENIQAVTEALKSCIYPPARVFVQNHILRLCLIRESIIKEVLSQAESVGLNYGSSNILADKCIMVHHDYEDKGPASDVQYVRGLLLHKHFRVLAHMTGAAVQDQKVQAKRNTKLTQTDEDPDCSNFTQKKWVTATDIDNEMPSLESSLVEQKDNCKSENMATYMPTLQRSIESVDKKFPLKESGLDSTLQYDMSSKTMCDIINVSICRDKYYCSRQAGKNIIYSPILNVHNNKKIDLTRQNYADILVNELQQAAAAKQEMNGQNIGGKGWDEFLQSQAEACMILQFLSVSPNTQIKVEVQDNDNQNTREWAFILYNYARLCVLFESFHSKVTNGDMPPLPDISEVNLSLLSTDDEWALIWVFILDWPVLMDTFAQDLLNAGNTLPKFSAVVRFLSSLSHRLSTYYSRYHVLPQTPQNHLFPQMYARLHLLRIVQRLMEICFHTLGVTPPQVM